MSDFDKNNNNAKDGSDDDEDDKSIEVKSKQELRCAPLKNALKTFVVDHISKYFTVACMRALIRMESEKEIWTIRQVIEECFAKDDHVVGFFSCGTALKTKVGGEFKEMPGISFWVMFDWPECGIAAYESHLSKLVMEAGLDLYNCKAIRGRSKLLFLYLTS